MSAPSFNILVCGIQKDFDAAKVKAQFSTMFKLEPAHVERVFNVAPIVLRRNIPEDFANSLVKRLSAIGVSAQKVNVENLSHSSHVSKAIYVQDRGEISSDSSAMHQPVDFLYGEHERRIPFIFTGSGFAYCKLWLLNVLVCILSAGVLYPWAKSRSLSYLYNHTYLDTKSFQCAENSNSIYVLQCLLLLFLGVMGLCFSYSFVYFSIVFFVFIALFPYYLYKCNQLHYGHFLFCSLGVRPDPSLRDTYMSVLLWPILALLTCGLVSPKAAYRIHHMQLHKKHVGNCEFKFIANPNKYQILLLSLLPVELLIGACSYWRATIPVYTIIIIVLSALFLVFIHWRVTLEKLRWNNLQSPLGYFICSWSLASYSRLLLQNGLFCLLTFGLYWPWAKINIANYKSAHLSFFSNQRFSKWQKLLNK